jgi:lipopolysaccharide export system protein LptA
LGVSSYKKNLIAGAMFLLAAVLVLPVQAFSKGEELGKGTAKKPISVTSDSMEVDTKANLVVFKGNVEAIESFTLCSDELYVRYDDSKQVSEIKAKGSVRIFQDGRTATSREAVFSNRERTIILTGEPQVKQCKDTVKGDKITIYVDQKNALVESGTGGRVKAVIMPDKDCAGGTADKVNSEETRCKGPR